MANKELAKIDPEAVAEKIRQDKALTLIEAAVGFDIPYTYLKRMEGLPLIANRLFPSDFVRWRRQQTGLESKPVEQARPRAQAADKPYVPRRMRD